VNFEISENKGERIWGASSHAIEQFISRNKFLNKNDYRASVVTMLKMMNKATLLTYDLEQNSDIYVYGSWIFVCKESTIVTVYEKKNSKWEHMIY
jgi:hypothetical protein